MVCVCGSTLFFSSEKPQCLFNRPSNLFHLIIMKASVFFVTQDPSTHPCTPLLLVIQSPIHSATIRINFFFPFSLFFSFSSFFFVFLTNELTSCSPGLPDPSLAVFVAPFFCQLFSFPEVNLYKSMEVNLLRRLCACWGCGGTPSPLVTVHPSSPQ